MSTPWGYIFTTTITPMWTVVGEDLSLRASAGWTVAEQLGAKQVTGEPLGHGDVGAEQLAAAEGLDRAPRRLVEGPALVEVGAEQVASEDLDGGDSGAGQIVRKQDERGTDQLDADASAAGARGASFASSTSSHRRKSRRTRPGRTRSALTSRCPTISSHAERLFM